MELKLSLDKNLNILFIDNNIEINKTKVLKINYDINMHKYSKKDISKCVNNNIEDICKNNQKYILLLDCINMKNENFDLIKLKYIVNNINESLNNYIYKCIIYNYNDTHKMIINMILLLIDDENREKVIFQKTFSDFIK